MHCRVTQGYFGDNNYEEHYDMKNLLKLMVKAAALTVVGWSIDCFFRYMNQRSISN